MISPKPSQRLDPIADLLPCDLETWKHAASLTRAGKGGAQAQSLEAVRQRLQDVGQDDMQSKKPAKPCGICTVKGAG